MKKKQNCVIVNKYLNNTMTINNNGIGEIQNYEQLYQLEFQGMRRPHVQNDEIIIR